MMMKPEITIRMPKESLAKWLEALRSGKYSQAAGKLEVDNRFCCLGVLQHCLTGHTVAQEDEELPPLDWLKDNRIKFKNHMASMGQADNPLLPTIGPQSLASTVNDEGVSFEVISDAIEACAEGF